MRRIPQAGARYLLGSSFLPLHSYSSWSAVSSCLHAPFCPKHPVLSHGCLRLLSNRPNRETAFPACLLILSYVSYHASQMKSSADKHFGQSKIVNASISKQQDINTEYKLYFHSLMTLHHAPMHLIVKIKSI